MSNVEKKNSSCLTILVDADDTIHNLTDAWIWYLNDRYGTSVRRSDVTDWDFSKAFPDIRWDDVYEALFDVELWKRVKPLPGAVKYLKKLIDDGNEVYIVTASHPRTVDMKTQEAIFKNFPYLDYKHLIITSNKQMVAGDIIIDDAPHNLGGGRLGMMMTAPHNIEVSDDALAELNAVRVDGWKEIYELIHEYQKNKKNKKDRRSV